MNNTVFTDAQKVLFGRLPGQLVIQLTNHCNGTCPQCGMRKSALIERCSIPADRLRNVFRQCADSGIEAVSLTGGEPFINMNELFSALEYAGEAGIRYLRTGTNGFMLTRGGKSADMERISSFVKRLSATKVRNFWISVDSANAQLHEKMRGLPGVIEGICKALPVFHAHGLYPAVNLGINRNISGEPVRRLEGKDDEPRFYGAFESGFAVFFEKVIGMGFTMANVCYPMSSNNAALDDPAYGAISEDFIVSFSPRELQLIFKALLEVIPRFRDRIRIFTPLSVLYAMSRGEGSMLFPCLGGVRYFYMDSRDGHIYPCGFRGGEDLGDSPAQAVRSAEGCVPDCTKCHWECFRDPSQLFGMARFMLRHPIRAVMRDELDPVLRRLWLGDIKYYVRNSFFDGRTAPKES